MPYEWSSPPECAQLGAASSHQPGLRLSLSAHNALSREGFAGFIGATAALMAVPLLAFLGHTVLWVIAAALGSALCAIWLALKASWRRGQVREEFELWSDLAILRRINPNGQLQEWRANPYWVEVHMSKDDGPVPDYLTLRKMRADQLSCAFTMPPTFPKSSWPVSLDFKTPMTLPISRIEFDPDAVMASAIAFSTSCSLNCRGKNSSTMTISARSFSANSSRPPSS